ncbi:MAG: hypothetical protein R6W75_13140 [Smithellaceae bacterium]
MIQDSRIRTLVIAPMLFLCLCACQTTGAPVYTDLSQYNVNLYLKDYTPQVNPQRYEFYRDKKICLSNIRNDAQNTTNFFYYSRDNRVQYELANKANSPIKLIPGFFWYAYQKAFESVGIEAVYGCKTGMPEFWIVLQSLNDDEIRFKVHILKDTQTLYEKELNVIMKPLPERHLSTLTARAYEMIDLTMTAMLDDPGIKEILLRVD